MTKPDTRNEIQAALDAVLPEFLKVSEAAATLRLHSRTLDRYRITGGGPAYYMFGHCRCLRPGRPRGLGGCTAISQHLPDGRPLIGAMSC